MPDVEHFLSALDLDAEYEKRNQPVPGDEYLTELFQRRFGKSIQNWNSVYWFHLTKVPADVDFTEGILPLRLSLPKLWKTLISLQYDPRKRAILEKLRDTRVPNFQYNLKVGRSFADGPYAMLVKESAFQSNAIGNHDYLRTPEIVEDICNGYEQETGERMLDEVLEALKPCIVKFEDYDADDQPHLMKVLIHYCWSKCRSEELCFFSNTCFDAKGRTIPLSAIRRIEFLGE